MLQVRVSQALVLQCGAFTVLAFLALIHSCRGQSVVIAPSEPILAVVGEDITLPCYLEPAVNAFGMTLEWTRSDLHPRFVIVWRDGVELENKKHPAYKGRTSFFIDELQHGNISLKLSKVKISDEGRYRCFSPELGRDSTAQLVVGAVSSPDIQMTKNSSSVVVLQCESKGWYPQPEVFWLDGEGNQLPAEPTETVRGPDGLYTVSSRVTVEKRHSNNFTCRVHQKNINQTRETEIRIPGPSDSGSASSAPTIIGVIVGIMLILAAVFAAWKWRQNKIRNKKHCKDEETQKTREKRSNSVSNTSEQESLMGRETNREQLTEERETVNNLETFREETNLQTQVDEETHRRESNNAHCAVREGRELQTRQTDQPSAEGETNSGLDTRQEETETEPINDKRDDSNPEERETEGDLNNEEDETESVRDNTEQLRANALQTEEEERTESAGHETEVEEGRHGGQLTAERETVNNLETFRGETNLQTQVDEETHRRESNNAHCAVREGRELQTRQTDQPSAEGETNSGLDTSQEETETEPINDKRDDSNPEEREREGDLNNEEDETESVRDNTEQLRANALQTEEEERTESAGHETEVEEGRHGGQLTAERETQGDLDTEKEKLKKKLKAKERELKKFEGNFSRLEGQRKDKEEQIERLKLQLEEVERQREETERTLQSVSMEEDEMDPETQREAAEKPLLDTMKDLERKKAELQRELEKRETKLKGIKKDKDNETKKLMKAKKEKEEIIKKLGEETENQSDSDDSL